MASDGGDNIVQFPSQDWPIEEEIHQPSVTKIKYSPADLFIERLRELSHENIKNAQKKNADYANPDRPFANFELAPTLGVSVPRGMLVRMSDKLSRISNLLDRPAAVENESILDACSDLSNYALILRVWLEWEGARTGDDA